MKKNLSIVLAVVLLVMQLAVLPVFAASSAMIEDEALYAAEALYSMGLFSGTGTGSDGYPTFELSRQTTRTEAVVMLVRLLGKETEAAGGSYSHPFTDVPAWANNYVGYAYENDLAKGTYATVFGSEDAVTPQQFITFVLRALGYSDAKGDFTYADALSFAQSIKLIGSEYNNSSAFFRGDAAKVSYNALFQNLHTTSYTLLNYLYNGGASVADVMRYSSGKPMIDIGKDGAVAFDSGAELMPRYDVPERIFQRYCMLLTLCDFDYVSHFYDGSDLFFIFHDMKADLALTLGYLSETGDPYEFGTQNYFVIYQFENFSGGTTGSGSASGSSSDSGSAGSAQNSDAYYAEYPAVPDLGARKGITLAVKLEVNGGMAYCYDLNDFGSESIEVFLRPLFEAGFTYDGSFTDNDGMTIIVYKKGTMQVAAGIMADYFTVLVQE